MAKGNNKNTGLLGVATNALAISDDVIKYSEEMSGAVEKITSFEIAQLELYTGFSNYSGKARGEILAYADQQIKQLDNLRSFYSMLDAELKEIVFAFQELDAKLKNAIEKGH